MTAQQAIHTAARAGVSIAVDGTDLVLEAATDIPGDIIRELKRHKAEIVALLRLAEWPDVSCASCGAPHATVEMGDHAGTVFDGQTLCRPCFYRAIGRPDP
jgi:hypothetical protein